MMTLYIGASRPVRNSYTDSAKLLNSGGSRRVVRFANGPVAPFARTAPSPMHTSISAYLPIEPFLYQSCADAQFSHLNYLSSDSLAALRPLWTAACTHACARQSRISKMSKVGHMNDSDLGGNHHFPRCQSWRIILPLHVCPARKVHSRLAQLTVRIAGTELEACCVLGIWHEKVGDALRNAPAFAGNFEGPEADNEERAAGHAADCSGVERHPRPLLDGPLHSTPHFQFDMALSCKTDS